MCGACGGLPSDWAVPLVSGHRRRSAIARYVGGVCTGVAVRAVPQGWLVTGATGAARVMPTLDRLLDGVFRRLTATGWADLEASLRDHENGAAAEPYPGYRPREAPHPPAALTVMSVPSHGSLHVRLAAFGLGIRAFDRRAVALDARERETPFRLLASDGRILGSAP
ncbi:hypothetical protein ABGB18_45495 [Nonomuraea sp. B12E4]|uniref:hypothetical protein n=1 Tax=Nonomuraea sp. B12E4 TaxID=3153564 RepID=UPI00325CBA64